MNQGPKGDTGFTGTPTGDVSRCAAGHDWKLNPDSKSETCSRYGCGITRGVSPLRAMAHDPQKTLENLEKDLGAKPGELLKEMSPEKPFKRFEIRWGEYIGRKECPFLRRWVITAWGYSLRLHQWLASDDQRHFHDHPWDFWSLILKGGYWEKIPAYTAPYSAMWRGLGSITRYPAEHKHMVQLPEGTTCWSLVFSKPNRRKFGYWLPGRDKPMRHLRYFSRYGLHPCE